jgi:hypothetical protein
MDRVEQEGRALRAWDPFLALLGEWEGEASGNTGQGTGRFSFELALDENIVVRRNRAEYPAAEGQGPLIHDDLMTVYPEGNRIRAIYVDNERHVIHYTAVPSSEPGTLTLASDPVPGAPRFRLHYRLIDDSTAKVRFEMAQPGKPQAFVAYQEGTARRVR